MEKQQLLEIILRSFRQLLTNDGILMGAPIEEIQDSPELPRKLHEVCINHKLAEYLAAELNLIPGLQPLFVDIEFNREGGNFKDVFIAGNERRVRPDIIVHNRKSGPTKFNFLVVECKKADASPEEMQKDCEKIHGFMTDPKYEYNFGLQTLYGSNAIEGTLFYKSNGIIEKDSFNCDLDSAQEI